MDVNLLLGAIARDYKISIKKDNESVCFSISDLLKLDLNELNNLAIHVYHQADRKNQQLIYRVPPPLTFLKVEVVKNFDWEIVELGNILEILKVIIEFKQSDYKI